MLNTFKQSYHWSVMQVEYSTDFVFRSKATLAPLYERQIRRLRRLGLIKRVARTYRYYLTRAGRAVIAAASHITEYGIVPALA